LPSDWIVIEVSSYNDDEKETPYPYSPSSFSHFSPTNSSSSTPTLTVINETNKAILPKPIAQELICPKDQKLQKGCYVILDGPDASGR